MSKAATEANRVVSLNGLRRDRSPGQRLLAECRDLFVERLSLWMKSAAAPVSEELFVLADSTRDRLQQTSYLDLRAEIEKDWPRLVDTFRRNLSAEAERCQNQEKAAAVATPLELPDFEGLALVNDDELSEHIVIREFAAQLGESCDEELYTLNRRVAVLLGDSEPVEGSNPLAPLIVCRALSDACATIGADGNSRLLLMRRLERHLHLELPAAYRDTNAHLIERGILPDFKRNYRRSTVLPNLPPLPSTAPGGTAPGQGGSNAVASSWQSGGPAGSASGEGILEALQRLAQARGERPLAPQATHASNALPSTGAADSAHPPAASAQNAAIDSAAIRQFLVSSLDELRVSQLSQQSQAAPADPGQAIINEVRIVRDSDDAKALGGLASVTIDVVAMLFDFIFDDAHLPVAVKALISRLQIPVLKVAMLDSTFFSDRQHPARRFLGSVSGISVRWGRSVDEADPFYRKLAELVDRIQRDFASEVEIFATALAELEEFVGARDGEEETTALAAADTVLRRERELEAWARARKAVQDFSAGAPQPTLIDAFLAEHWVGVLQSTALNHDVDSDEWQAANALMKDLAWSVQAKKSPDDRLRLIGMLPGLLARINAGLDSIAATAAQRDAFFDALVRCHACALRGEAQAAPPPPQEAPPAEAADALLPAPDLAANSDGELFVTRSVDNGVEVEEVELVGAAPIWRANDRDIFRQVSALQRGDWVEFHERAEGEESAGEIVAYRERLHWISPQRGILLFSNHRSAKAIAITPEALARQVRDGNAIIVEDEAIFERALSGAIETISAG